MKYVIGIDSGGTKYLVKACDLDGNELARYVGAPAAHYRLSREEMLERINRNLDGCLDRFGGRREDCAFLVCGTTGLDSERDQITVDGIYSGLPGFDCPIHCVNDAEVAHFAVTGGVGAVVIAGTGSIAFGRNARGETTRSGGWPPCIFGDDGSGTWISCRALYHLTLWFDGRVPSTPLSDLLLNTLKLKKPEELIALCIQIEQMRWENPGLAALVDKAAALGDSYALHILEEAADHTFALADSIVTKLRLNEDPSFRVGAWGSAIVKSPLHFARFQKLFQDKYSNVQVLVADADAATGACRIALHRMRHSEKEKPL